MSNQRKQSKPTTDMSMSELLDFPSKWNQYKSKFKKVYDDEQEESLRKQIFFERFQLIEKHNKKFKNNMVGFKIMATELSDRTRDEINLYYEQNAKSTLSLVAHMGADDDSDRLDEEWENFKSRNKKKFNSPSDEEIPKLFFLSKLQEISQLTRELKKDGLIVDIRDVNEFCNYKESRGTKTMLDDLNETKKKSENEQKKHKNRPSLLLEFD